MNYDNFKSIFKEINVNLRRFKYHLKNNNLSSAEKKLLTSVYAYKSGDLNTLFNLLKSKPLSEKFLEATRLYLIGLSQNHIGKFNFANEHLIQSVKMYQELQEREFQIFAQSALAISYGNQKNLEFMAKQIEELDTLESVSIHCDLLRFHAKTVYLSINNKPLECLDFIESIWNTHISQREIFIPSFLVLQFYCLFKLKNYRGCEQVLERYKQSNGTVVKVNYKFMKTLLGHIADNKPIYVYKQDFEDFPELYSQIEVIKSLQISEIDNAKMHWSQLQKHNPKLYSDNFCYLGDECLFSVALEKHITNQNEKEFNQNDIDKINSLIDKLIYIMNEAKYPIAKEKLIKLIWNEELNESNDQRLKRLISRYRKQTGLNIKNTKGTYFLEKPKYQKIS